MKIWIFGQQDNSHLPLILCKSALARASAQLLQLRFSPFQPQSHFHLLHQRNAFVEMLLRQWQITASPIKISQTNVAMRDDVSGYTINAATGTLTPISGSPFAAVAAPLSVVVDPTGRFVYVANANTANVSGYTINAITGVLTPISGSPFAAGAAPSSVVVHPAGKFAYVANIGSANVSGYTINAATGVLTPISGSPFAARVGPRSVTTTPRPR